MNQIPFIVIFLKYGIGTSKSLQGLSEISAGFGVNLCWCWRDSTWPKSGVYALNFRSGAQKHDSQRVILSALFYGPLYLTHGGIGGDPRQYGDSLTEPSQFVDLLPLVQSVAAHQGRP